MRPARLLLVLVLAAAPAGPVALAAEQPAVLEEVGHDDLGARGLNSGLALAERCAYVGSRGQGQIEIVDVSEPAHPRRAGSLASRPLTTARELRAVPELGLLVVLSYALGRGGANRFDIYHWDEDCARPAPVGAYDFGGRAPHEFYLWRAPDGGRTLLFTAMFSGGSDDLQVVDVSDPASPRLAGSWSPPVGSLHSVALSPDGRRAFLSLWTGGLLVADASRFTTGQPGARLEVLTPAGQRLAAPPGGNVHSAVPVPGRDLLLLTDERYPPACPYGPARLVDVSDPARPRQLSILAGPENDPAACRDSPVGTYTSHNPTPVGDLALVTWYSSGLQVFDIADPSSPRRLTEFRPQASQPGLRDPQLGATQAMTWSYPVVRDGLVYVADINQGLYVLRYRGPHQEQLEQVAFAEGNSNLSARRPAAAPSRPPETPPGVVPAATPRPAPASSPAAAPLPIVAGGGLLAVLLIAGGLMLTWYRGHSRR